MFWAEEFGFTEAISLLLELGSDPSAVDAGGKTPKQLGEENVEINKGRTFPGNSPEPDEQQMNGEEQEFDPNFQMNAQPDGEDYPVEDEEL